MKGPKADPPTVARVTKFIRGNTLHVVVAKRVRQPQIDSMKVDSTDTASVSRIVRRARRVARSHSALRTRGTGHCAAASQAVSCVLPVMFTHGF